MVFSLGDFRYYNGGDFSAGMKKPDGSRVEIEDFLAAECPQVDVAKANHHGHHSMPDALVKALRARVVVAGVWHDAHMNRPTMRRLAKADWPCLYAPGILPERRRREDAAEPWLKDFAPESFKGVHAVVDVAPDGANYRLMMVSAADEQRRIRLQDVQEAPVKSRGAKGAEVCEEARGDCPRKVQFRVSSFSCGISCGELMKILVRYLALRPADNR